MTGYGIEKIISSLYGLSKPEFRNNLFPENYIPLRIPQSMVAW
jgi:hypothetical protein